MEHKVVAAARFAGGHLQVAELANVKGPVTLATPRVASILETLRGHSVIVTKGGRPSINGTLGAVVAL